MIMCEATEKNKNSGRYLSQPPAAIKFYMTVGTNVKPCAGKIHFNYRQIFSSNVYFSYR